MLIYDITLRHLLKHMLKMDYGFYSLLTLHLSKWLITIFICLFQHRVVSKKKEMYILFLFPLPTTYNRIATTLLRSVLWNHSGAGLRFGTLVDSLVFRESEQMQLKLSEPKTSTNLSTSILKKKSKTFGNFWKYNLYFPAIPICQRRIPDNFTNVGELGLKYF